MRGHARAPHLQPDGMGEDGDAGRDRAGALQGDAAAVVAPHQPVSGHVGAERMPARPSTLRRLRDCGRMSKNWGPEEERPMRSVRFVVGAVLLLAMTPATLFAQAGRGTT